MTDSLGERLQPEIIDAEPVEEESVELERRPATGLAAADEATPEMVLAQVHLVQEVMRQAMTEGIHYGKVGNVSKPSLYKPGAEKLCLTFRLKPSYTYERLADEPHVTYIATCTLTHINSGVEWAQGVGSCTSREDRYAYRWQKRDQRPSKEVQDDMRAQGTGRFRQVRGAWQWQERLDNPNPAEQDNTILKMAGKRALVAAVLNALAVSDIFTQDVEDTGPAGQVEEAPPAAAAPAPKQATKTQVTKLRKAIKQGNDINPEIWSEENVVAEAHRQWGGIEKLEDLNQQQVQVIMDGIADWIATTKAKTTQAHVEDGEGYGG